MSATQGTNRGLAVSVRGRAERGQLFFWCATCEVPVAYSYRQLSQGGPAELRLTCPSCEGVQILRLSSAPGESTPLKVVPLRKCQGSTSLNRRRNDR